MEVLEFLINKGLDINHRTNNGATALFYAADRNIDESHLEIIETLLKYRADVNVRSFEFTALWFLLKKSSNKIIKFFLDSKADIHAVTDKGYNLLLPAIHWNGKVEVVQMLLDLGFDLNQRS